MPPKSQIIWDYSIPNAQIKFGAEHSKFCASQIIYGIPNYLWHPKLLMASQIIYGIPNYLWHPKLFDIPNYYDIPNLGFPLTFEIFPIIYQIISKGVNMCNI